MQPLSSATTGALAVATQLSSVGPRPGTTGSSTSLTVSDETARDWLLRQQNPEATDAALCRSLTSTLGVMASPRTEWRFPQDADAYRVTVGCSFEVVDEALIPDAIAKIRQAMTPATTEQCEGWLVMLQAATARRADTEATSAVAYSLYAAELRQWPADVAKAACAKLARGKGGKSGTNWFPTLAEMAAECERLASPRQVMLYALERRTPDPLPHPNDRRLGSGPSEDEKARVHQMAEEARHRLREAADRAKPHRRADMPPTAGKTDETGITQEMRELIARRAAE